jgi:hypothetical protein
MKRRSDLSSPPWPMLGANIGRADIPTAPRPPLRRGEGELVSLSLWESGGAVGIEGPHGWAWRAVLLAAMALLIVAGCSPEGERVRAGGRGADVGNSAPPIGLHGNRARNNPDFQVPRPGRAPLDARGAPGWWANRADANAR